jgi:rRNA-processing protein FCF1
MQIVIDTNFLITCVNQKIDLIEQLETSFVGADLIIVTRVMDELEKISKKAKLRGKYKEAASLALKMLGNEIKKNRVKIMALDGNVDDAIVSYSKGKEDIIVASLDRGIKKRLKNTRFLTIREKRRIVEA